MNYHNITKCDMNNGDGLRVVLWVSGCEHHCEGCQNPITWNSKGGLYFGVDAYHELMSELNKPYISGITFSGGDPLHPQNRYEVEALIAEITYRYGDTKTIWLYTGYTWEEIYDDPELYPVIELVDVLVDGKFEKSLLDKNAHWVGSTNQRVIDVQNSLITGRVVLYDTN